MAKKALQRSLQKAEPDSPPCNPSSCQKNIAILYDCEACYLALPVALHFRLRLRCRHKISRQVTQRNSALTCDVFFSSYLGSTLRQANIEPMPSLSDVRRIITEFCVLPLGKEGLNLL